MALARTMLTAALLALAGAALSAGDGMVGSESQTTALISFTKQNAVRISGVGDADFGTQSNLSVAARYTDDFCVYSSTGAYAVTVSSANGAFELRTEDGLSAIPYRLQWIAGSVVDLLPGIPTSGFPGHATKLDCNGRVNAKYRVIITPANFNAADPGAYRDTLTLLVRPE